MNKKVDQLASKLICTYINLHYEINRYASHIQSNVSLPHYPTPPFNLPAFCMDIRTTWAPLCTGRLPLLSIIGILFKFLGLHSDLYVRSNLMAPSSEQPITIPPSQTERPPILLFPTHGFFHLAIHCTKMASYHRILKVFGRSVQDKTLQCDWYVHPKLLKLEYKIDPWSSSIFGLTHGIQ